MSSFKPVKWLDQRPNNIGSTECGIFIELVNQKSSAKYAVRQSVFVLSKKGIWYYEPMPSNRTDQFLEECRFATLDDAVHAASCQNPEGVYSLNPATGNWYTGGMQSWNDS